jgi:3-phytase/alkaline phosphatase D
MRRSLIITGATAALLAPSAPALGNGNGHHASIQFRGQAIIPTGTTFQGTQVGGLSSITYDAARGVFYAISDDPADTRYYSLRLRVADGALSNGDVEVTGVTRLQAPGGGTYAATSIDPEGLALTPDRDLVVTSEGYANSLVDPFVRRYSLDGRFLGDFEVPQAFRPNAEHTRGVRQNLGFESAGVAEHGNFLFTGSENALVQDGPAASLTDTSPARLLRYNLHTGRLDRQWVYVTDRIKEPSSVFSVNGLVELLPRNNEFLISMERSFSVGAPGTGNSIKLYDVALPGATNVNGAESLSEVRRVRPVDKKLLFDLDTLGIPLDNVEGLTFGPRLRDGRQSLVLVSDNNFAATQFTQFLLFALDR